MTRSARLMLAGCLAALSLPVPTVGLAQNITAKRLHIFHVANSDRWHMSVNQSEINQIRSFRKEWQDKGSFAFAFETSAVGTVPLYRFMNLNSGDHLFTTNRDEGMNAIKFFGYTDEGVCCYVSPSSFDGGTPIFRLLKNGQHRYVFSAAARDNLTFNEGWKLEGTEGYAWLPPTCPDPSLPAQ